MSITPPRPQMPSFVPESAPFTLVQRAWLNGLFAGVFGVEGGVTPLSKQDVAKLFPGLVDAPADVAEPIEDDDGAPWHDPAMSMPDRMKLAEGRPLPRRMMAAMAQQDCSQCGYNCEDYADALATKKELRLNLCVPGGKDTARMLKNLYAELGVPQPAAEAVPTPAPTAAPGRSRDSPVHRHVPLAPPSQQGRLGKGNLARRIRPRRMRPRLQSRRFLRHLSHQRSRSGRRRAGDARRPGAILRSADGICARFSPTACRYRPRPTCCSS